MRSTRALLAAAVGLALLALGAAPAEAAEITIAQQYGISYLPFMVMKARNLIEERARAEGVEVTPHWLSFTGGPPMNEALISGNLDIASGGVAPMLVIWDRTRTNMGVRGLAALDSMPLYLNTTDPKVKTLADFSSEDRIALPAAKVSIQAIVLEMAAAKAFGATGYGKLNGLTVSMAHPDGMSSLLNGTAGITAHFTAAPFQYLELDHPNVHRVLDSYDVLEGPHTFNVIWTTKRFVQDKPKLVQAFGEALRDAETFIRQQPAEAARIYLASEKSDLSPEAVEKIIRDPENDWSTTPKRVLDFGRFMQTTGLIRQAPASIDEVFFPGTPEGSGN